MIGNNDNDRKYLILGPFYYYQKQYPACGIAFVFFLMETF